MTILSDVLIRLSHIGCRPVLEGGDLHVRGAIKQVPDEIMSALRQAKPALIVELLREQARTLSCISTGTLHWLNGRQSCRSCSPWRIGSQLLKRSSGLRGGGPGSR